MINFNVNGTLRTFDGDEDMPLLWHLRDDLRLTGTRFGCGLGLCGACTVHVDGQSVRACQTKMSTLNNKKVVTIEGLSTNGDHPVQRAWAEAMLGPYLSCRRLRLAIAREEFAPRLLALIGHIVNPA